MTVVLDEPVDAVPIDHAGHESVLALESGIPRDEFAQRRGQSGLGEGGSHDHAVSHPRPGVAARSRLDGGAVAVDEDVPGSGAETIESRSGAGRNQPVDVAEFPPPAAEGVGAGSAGARG